jgi:uncharacterized coiled-coil DUF342 family protein
MVSPIDRIILTTSIESIQTINQQIDTVSKEISKYACRNDKEEELRKKEKMLEALREGTKLSWDNIWIRVDDNAIA